MPDHIHMILSKSPGLISMDYAESIIRSRVLHSLESKNHLKAECCRGNHLNDQGYFVSTVSVNNILTLRYFQQQQKDKEKQKQKKQDKSLLKGYKYK